MCLADGWCLTACPPDRIYSKVPTNITCGTFMQVILWCMNKA
jgi:hypothetical protein